MFTGIVREIGTVEGLQRSDEGARLRVRAGLAAELNEGDSVSVSGACLTAVTASGGAFEVDIANQTLAVTTLGGLGPGDLVNLEPPLRAGDPLGGHLVQGHVDGTGEVSAVEADGIARRLRLMAPNGLGRFIVERGSVAVDGVSLTVAALAEGGFEVSLIPETLQRTTLGALAEGGRVNLEVDVIARYAEQLMQGFEIEERTKHG
jgi:riboflavin synthase